MNKEPLALYLFRLILMLGLFAFIGMLYWSSLLIEQDLKLLQDHLIQVKTNLNTIQDEVTKGQSEILETLQSGTFAIESKNQAESSIAEDHIQNNLLHKDPFYQETLPKMLGKKFHAHGIRKEALLAKPDHLHPFSNWSYVANWYAMCIPSLSSQAVGRYETYVPDLAKAMQLRYSEDGRPEYWIFLRQDAFWQPLNPAHFNSNTALAPHFLQKHPVTAHDIKFYYDALMNPLIEEAASLRLYYTDVEEIRVIDDYTLVVRWKADKIKNENGKEIFQTKYSSKLWTGALRPLPCFVYQYFANGSKILSEDSDLDTYRTNPVWAQNFSHHWAKNVIVSCGAWLFDGMTEREIRFKRNPHFHNPLAVLVDAFEVRFKDHPDGIWADFKLGTLDLFQLPPNQQGEFDRFLQSPPYQKQVKQGASIKRLDFLDRSFTYIGWNQARSFFNRTKVRQALTMAIDRERIIRQNLNGMGKQITGPFFPLSPSYNATLKPYPYDVSLAKQLLQEEGWFDSDGDGTIEKMIDGKLTPFQFKLVYYVKSPTAKAICDYIATALKEVGISCEPNGVDIADLSATFEDKNFDAILLAWSLGTPPEDPKQLWYSTGAKEKGSSNAIGFENAEVDKIIDQLSYEYDPKKRLELYHRFNAIIYEEAPYTFLYTPKIALLYREYLQNVFIPAKRQDLIPGANVGEPESNLYWLKTSP